MKYLSSTALSFKVINILSPVKAILIQRRYFTALLEARGKSRMNYLKIFAEVGAEFIAAVSFSPGA